MHSDARTLSDGTEIEGDLCIIGAGAAGISIAREFAETKHNDILLEAGGFERAPDTQSLYEGESTGLSYFPLDETHLRYFGERLATVLDGVPVSTLSTSRSATGYR